MTHRSRANGEGSIFPYRNGYAAYVWVDKPDGRRGRKYVYGQTREVVHEKWVKLQSRAAAGPVATKMQTLGDYLAYWLREVIERIRYAEYLGAEGPESAERLDNVRELITGACLRVVGP